MLTTPPGRQVRLGSHVYPLVLPTVRDPRLHLAAVILTLQLLGQTVLGFELSIAQILVSIGTCAALELMIYFRRTRSIVWPASAMLTGNGVAFILRVPGTRHGDWWSLNGWYIFAGVAAVSLLSKYLIRYKGRHIFNPSNLGLVLAFLILGENRVEPLDFWWGPISPPVVAALLVIVIGGLLIVSRLDLLGMAAGFWLTFAAALGLLAASGHCMSARWRFGPVCGSSFWWVLVTSPEILVFTFFMITDPKTTPAGRVGRVLFGMAVALEAVLFVAPQQTEYSTKVAVLSALVVVCAVRPWLEKLVPAKGAPEDRLGPWFSRLILGGPGTGSRRGIGRAVGGCAATVALVVFAGYVIVTASTPARTPIAELRAADAMVSRPEIPIDLAAYPAFTISPKVLKFDADMTEPRARPMISDFLADLQIEADARQKGDVNLAATGAGAARLNALKADIEAGKQKGEVEVTTYSVDSIGLVPVYDLVNAQAGPQYGVEIHGTAHKTVYGGSPATRVISTVDEPFARTFALLYRGGHYVIAADYPPTPE